ncbi:MAG: ribonucleoside-diphosphate reductase, adenosylcobalamin-dependent, partial [Methanosarcinales archaeon]|nr:ribonucleoside-diphosphate reductase, adenosylcobalamin-dependent [Methanosarcinales archaeon]
MIRKIRKRDMHIVDFDPGRIERAIGRAFEAQGIVDPRSPAELAARVVAIAGDRFGQEVPHVEDIQDVVE